MKRLSVAAVITALLLTLTGCFEKDFESSVVLRGAKNLNFSAGDTKTVTAELPAVEGVRLTAISRDPALDVEITADNTLTLSCDTAGAYVLTLRIEAKGYRTKETRYPVEVTIQPMQITVALQDSNASDLTQGFTLGMGDETMLLLSGAPDAAEYSIQNTVQTVVEARQQEDGIKLTALSSGETVLQIEVICAGYEPFSVTLPVKVDKPLAQLELAVQSVSGSTQDKLKVTCLAFEPGGRLLAKAADPAVSAVVEGNIIRIASTKAGSFTVTVSCEAEGYHTATQTVQADFTMPPVPLSLPASLLVTLGQTKEVTVAGLPEDATLSLSGGNSNIAFENRSGVLAVEGRAVGSASITVTASCAGYADSRAVLPVTVSGVEYSVSTRYNSYVREIVALVNEERAALGLSPLGYLPELEGACQLRAKEAAVVWDHTRPDGRSWKTVLTDMGYTYYTAGENLLGTNVLDAEKAVEAWMNSPGHRENIVRAEFTGICIGIVQGGDGDYYYAQLFITKE